jgi:hypothetical protein
MKFGHVSRQEVAMEVFEADPSVDAAVMCEYGVYEPKTNTFTWNMRFKVFRKEGLKYLIMTIPAESKSHIRGKVFNLKNGKVVESNLKKESIYQERIVGRYTRMRIAPPNAREGSVVDIRFTLNGLPGMWRFQKEIPVLWSELIIPPNEYITFNQRTIGFEPLYFASGNRWIAKEMPPFHPEPFISSKNNYMTTMFIEISDVHIPAGASHNGYYQSFTGSWEDVSDLFYEDSEYGELLRNANFFLNQAADEIRSVSDSEAELVQDALQRIRQDVTWNKEERLFPSLSLRKVYEKEKMGNSADMNFLFLSLLSKLDIECYPMIISTRDEGLVNPYFPSISRFNYTISYVKIDDTFRPIDAADKYYPPDMLNMNCLNSGGLVVKKDGGQWVEIRPEKQGKKLTNCSLELHESGMIEGVVQIHHAGYTAVDFRKKRIKYTTEAEYLEKFEQNHPGIMVLDYSVENLDEEFGNVTETFTIEIEGNANGTAGMIYLNPVVMDRLKENPFRLDQRKYPVDFTYGRNEIYILNLTLPDGFVPEQIPAPVKVITEDKSASFQYNVQQMDHMVQVMNQVSINQPVFLESEYEKLKALYNMMVNKEAEPVVVKQLMP